MLKFRLKSILFLCFLSTVTFAAHEILISLQEIQVSGNLESGGPCSHYTGLGIQCFPRPKICVEPSAYANNDTKQCAIGSFIDLGIFNNTNDATFDLNVQYGGWRNPYLFTFFGDFKGFQIKMIVWNADGPNYNLIGNGTWNIAEAAGNVTLAAIGNIQSVKFGWEHGYQAPTTTENTPPEDF